MTTYTSKLYCDGDLIDQYSQNFKSGLTVIEHNVEGTSGGPLKVSVGYFNWWSVGIEVKQSSTLIYQSHPDKNIHCMVQKLTTGEGNKKTPEKTEVHSKHTNKWKKNKPSILADIGLGAVFFVVSKVTGDLTTAALTSVFLGLALVAIQPFVKVDLLGGFAIFGTVMLLISALFSLYFQSEFLVQLKGTFMGLISASVLLCDGVFRQGRYFGARFERYLLAPIAYQYFTIGFALVSLVMAAINYAVAILLTEDQWLTYTTFVDLPIYLLAFMVLVGKAEKTNRK